MMRTRILLILATILLAGCVDATPFEPEMCEFRPGEIITYQQLRVCALPVIKTTARRKG